MRGVSGLTSGNVHVVWFTEPTRDRRSEYLVGAVVWRRPLTAPKRSWREALRILWPRRGEPEIEAPPATPSHPDVTGRASEGNGEREVQLLYGRRLLRVLGQDYELPAGEDTLVLLVDEPPGAPGSAAVVESFTLHLPPQPRTTPDWRETRTEKATHLAEQSRRLAEAWEAGLRADPRIGAFWPADE